MRLLLDTHIFLWWADAPERLSAQIRSLCEDPATLLLLSLVSLWEIQIKVQIGKLTLASSLKTIIETQQQTNRIQILPVTVAHILALENLPRHHKDPFDRLLIAQASSENAYLASMDAVFPQYSVNLIQ